jgi:signal transduction histidine kinase/ActR/RegA family two-component response regulator
VLRTNGAYQVATEGGLAVLEDGAARVRPTRLDLPPGPVLALAPDDRRSGIHFFVVGDRWFGEANNESFRLLGEHPRPGADILLWTASPDGNGGLFLGNRVALYHFNPVSGFRLLDEATGLTSLGATDLLLDREGSVWVSALRGVSRIDDFRFATYLPEHGLFDDEVTAALDLGDDRLVFGHRDGLTFWERGELRTLAFDDSVPTEHGLGRVLDLAKQADGTIWIAGTARGLGRMRDGRIEWSMRGAEFGVTSVLVDREDRLWVSDGHGILVDRGDGIEPIPFWHRHSHGVRRLFEGAGGDIYVATMGVGLYRWNGERLDRWLRPERPEYENVWAVLERPDGSIWAGTAGGLVEAVDGTFRAVDSPAIDRPIYFMFVDDQQRVWFGTDNGVLRWNGERLVRFSVEEGLGARETNRAAGILDSLGRIWIGTTRGVTLYRSELDRGSDVAPTLRLLGLGASGEDFSLADPLRLATSQNDLVFAFRAILHSDPRNMLLQSWLEGDEPDWSAPYSSTDQLARYTNLPPGRYRFHVRAGTRSGVWSDPASSPEIVIVRPLWLRPWFWLLGAACAIAVGLAAYRYVYRERQAQRLEAEVRLRVEELRNAETELAKARQLQSLGILAGGIAHDFNNLLTVVLGNLSLLMERADPGSRKWIEDAEAAVERARELTAQLLTFSKGGAPVRNPARIDEVIRDSAAFVLSGSHVGFATDLPSDLHVVDIDSGQINQVLNNLLINAVQAMPEGGTVHVCGRNTDAVPGKQEPGDFVAIEVRDEGPGIPREHLSRIFDPYFSTKADGSGLGLATAYSIVSRHGGLLTVDSEPGHGSTFTVYLPATRESLPAPAHRRGLERFPGTRVLIMDDDDRVRSVIQEMLESLGCRVTPAADGEEAVFRYSRALGKQERFDLVILDLTVRGGMGGEETMRRLREIDPGVRAVVASGYGNSPVMSDHRSHGFCAMLKKPFELDTVAETLRRALGTAPASAVDSVGSAGDGI